MQSACPSHICSEVKHRVGPPSSQSHTSRASVPKHWNEMHLNHCRFLLPANEACVKNSVHRGGGGFWSRGGAWSRRVPGSGGCLTGRLLLRAVRILLECILVCGIFKYIALVSTRVRQKRKHEQPHSVADPGFSKWGGAVLSQMGGRTSCFQVKSAWNWKK